MDEAPRLIPVELVDFSSEVNDVVGVKADEGNYSPALVVEKYEDETILSALNATPPLRLVVDADEIFDFYRNFHLSCRSTEADRSLVSISFQKAGAHICGEAGTRHQKTEYDDMLLRLRTKIPEARGAGQKFAPVTIPGGNVCRDFNVAEL